MREPDMSPPEPKEVEYIALVTVCLRVKAVSDEEAQAIAMTEWSTGYAVEADVYVPDVDDGADDVIDGAKS